MARKVKKIKVPHYPECTLEKVMEWTQDHPSVQQYLPAFTATETVSKKWLCNICATVEQVKFRSWVRQKVEERRQRFNKKRRCYHQLVNPVKVE